MQIIFRFLFLSALFFSVGAAHAADDYTITIKDQQFSPKSLTIPANEKVKLVVKNVDSTPAEFESSDFNREKIVSPHDQIIVFVGPLAPGTYGYFNDFHRESTGTLVAK